MAAEGWDAATATTAINEPSAKVATDASTATMTATTAATAYAAPSPSSRRPHPHCPRSQSHEVPQATAAACVASIARYVAACEVVQVAPQHRQEHLAAVAFAGSSEVGRGFGDRHRRGCGARPTVHRSPSSVAVVPSGQVEVVHRLLGVDCQTLPSYSQYSFISLFILINLSKY